MLQSRKRATSFGDFETSFASEIEGARYLDREYKDGQVDTPHPDQRDHHVSVR